MFKKILPVAIGIVLILLISVTVSGVKSLNDRVPGIKNSDSTYATFSGYDVTYDRLYALMKNNYGTQEVINMIDEIIYKAEVKAVDVNSEAFLKFVNKQIFGEEDLKDADAEEAQKAWDEVISSLQVSGLLTAAQAADNAYDKLDSEVWKVVKDYYKLSYARTEWAKAEYVKKHQESRNDGLMFDVTNKENSTNSIEAYFKENYKGSVTGFFVPFTSKEAAYKMMNKYGINTHSKVIVHNGWVSSSYDYTTKKDIEESDELTYEQVFEAFVNMYNDVFRYQNNGNDIISATSYEKTLKVSQTKYLAKQAITNALNDLDKNFGTEVSLPTEINILLADGTSDKATVSWKVNKDTYGSLNEAGNVITPKFSEDELEEVTVSVTYTVTYKEESISTTVDFDFKAKYDEEGNLIADKKAVTVADVEAFYGVSFTEDFLNNVDDAFKFVWTYNDAKEVNETLAKYLSVDSTKLTLNEDVKQLYKSYTVTPVEVGNYFYLILKLENHEQTELFVKDADGNNQKDENDKYMINDQALYDEIVAKKTEELLSDNAINEMLYENRMNHNVQIFDSYIEAVYEYEYRQFYETTIKANDYKKYKTSKKNQKSVIFSLQEKAGDKKSVVKFTADDLFARLESKYASSCVATLVENYLLINDTKYNNIYNPYNDTVLNITTYKNLMEAEISTLRKNFESGYFTNSYLSYYGFTPNFPADYGWKKFIKDYFVAVNDQELLTVSTYGGSIYSDALAALTDDLYGWSEIEAEMNKALGKFFSVSTINLIISTDYNYDNDESNKNAAQILMDEKDNWSQEQRDLAAELGAFMYSVANQTNAATLADQMTALVTIYNEAAYEYSEVEWNQAKADGKSVYDFNYFGKYKLAGLLVKFEKAASYTSASSIMEEYADECRVLWKKAGELGLYDKTMDVPLVSENCVKTDYGYHKIAIVSASSAEALPSQEEVEIYRAQALVDAAQKEIDTADENIKNYSEKGYNTASYEAEKAVAMENKAKYEEALKATLAKYSKENDYKLDEEATARIKAWYTNAESAIEGGTLVTEHYIKELTNKVSFTNANGKATFETFLELLQKECDKQNEEE